MSEEKKKKKTEEENAAADDSWLLPPEEDPAAGEDTEEAPPADEEELEGGGDGGDGEGPPRSRWRTVLKVSLIAGAVLLVLGLSGATAGYYWISSQLPKLDRLDDYRPLVTAEVYDRNGDLVWDFYKDERRKVVPLDVLPKDVVHAFLAAEDARFYEHGGINWRAVARAAIDNLLAGKITQGASTITMQVAKTFFLTPERKFKRKAKEALLAIRMEDRLSKDEILFLYLNQIYFGNRAYGIQAASEMYFGKDAKNLTLAEAAILAGLPQAPSRYNPTRHYGRAKARQKYVLGRMLEEKMIDRTAYEKALVEPLKIVDPEPWSVSHPERFYYMEHIRQILTDRLGEDVFYRSGLRIEVPMDAVWQKYAYLALRKGLENLDRNQGYRGPLKSLQAAEIEPYFAAAQAKLDEEERRRILREGWAAGRQTEAREKADRVGKETHASLVLGETYEGVVTEILDDRNSKKARCLVRVGFSEGVLPIDKMDWARQPNPDVRPSAARIRRPSDALAKGDVILVRLDSIEEEKGAGEKPPERRFVFALDQRPEAQGALISIGADDGGVRAMLGGYDFRESYFNRAVQARRQPGSAFKGIVFLTALDDPHKDYTPSTVILDAPVVYRGPTDEDRWKPDNYGKRFHGEKTLSEALARSINTISIKIIMDIGVGRVVKMARRLGIESPLEEDPTLALGSSGVTPLELGQAFLVFPKEGYKGEPRFVTRVEDAAGRVLEEDLPRWVEKPPPETPDETVKRFLADAVVLDSNPLPYLLSTEGLAVPDPKEVRARLTEVPKVAEELGRVVSAPTAYVMTSMLKGVVNHGTGYGVHTIGRPAGGKTGTSNDNRDAWFIGFTPHLLTCVWTGYDDEQKSLGRHQTGGNTAAPIWLDFMQSALDDSPKAEFPVPGGVEFAMVDRDTGLLAREGAGNSILQAFVLGTAPKVYAPDENQLRPEDFYKEDLMLDQGEKADKYDLEALP